MHIVFDDEAEIFSELKWKKRNRFIQVKYNILKTVEYITSHLSISPIKVEWM